MVIKMKLNDRTAYVDGKPVTLLRAPDVKDGTTLVPVRFLAEALGLAVDYNAGSREITITDGHT